MDNRHLSPRELSVFKIKIVEGVEKGRFKICDLRKSKGLVLMVE